MTIELKENIENKLYSLGSKKEIDSACFNYHIYLLNRFLNYTCLNLLLISFTYYVFYFLTKDILILNDVRPVLSFYGASLLNNAPLYFTPLMLINGFFCYRIFFVLNKFKHNVFVMLFSLLIGCLISLNLSVISVILLIISIPSVCLSQKFKPKLYLKNKFIYDMKTKLESKQDELKHINENNIKNRMFTL